MGDTTGWATNDVICIASTSQTNSDCESMTVASVGGSTSTTPTSTVGKSHSGTSPTQAEVGNLTRNVKIRGVSATLCGYLLFQTTSTVACDYVEFTQLGSAMANKRGIDVTTTTGSRSITHGSLHDSTVSSSIGFNVTGGSSSNVTFSNNVVYNIAGIQFQTAATSGTWTADGNYFILNTGGNNLVQLNDVGGTFTNNAMVGTTNFGLQFGEGNATPGTMSGLTCHSGVGGFSFNSNLVGPATLLTLTAWRHTSSGFSFTASLSNLTFDTPVAFGNSSNNFTLTSAGVCLLKCVFLSITSNGDSTFATTNGGLVDCMFISGDFSTASEQFLSVSERALKNICDNVWMACKHFATGGLRRRPRDPNWRSPRRRLSITRTGKSKSRPLLDSR